MMWILLRKSARNQKCIRHAIAERSRYLFLPSFPTKQLRIRTMSRSALWRQEGAKKMREKEAEDLFSMAVEGGRVSGVFEKKMSRSREQYALRLSWVQEMNPSSFFWYSFQFILRLQNNPSKTLPLWGPDDSFHFNPVLLEKIIKHRYFHKCCREITDWNKLVDEIYYSVQDLEPFAMGKF